MSEDRIAELSRRMAIAAFTRRRLLKGAAGAGLAAALAAGGRRAVEAAPGSAARTSGRYQTDATTLVIADALSGGLWLTLDPSQVYEINPSALMNVVYEPLYHLPDSSQPDTFEPLLADGMPEVSADGLEVTIRLRSGVTFHNTGNEMTAEDWVFSWERLKSRAENPSYLASYWETVEAVDPLTLKLTLTAPNPALVAILTSTPLAVTDSKTVLANGGTGVAAVAEGAEATPGAEVDSATAFINENSVGTGPYRVTQFDIDTEVIIERNPDYWGDPPAFERMIWRNVTDVNAQLELVQTGEADIAVDLDPDSKATVEGDPNLQLLTADTISLQYLALHTQPDPGGPLATKEMRQALAYAIDYDGIIESLLAGAATRPATIVPLPMAGSEALLGSAYAEDLTRAQELFAAAGGGSEVSIALTYPTEYAAQGGIDTETLASKIQADLQRIDGLTVELDPRDATSWIEAYRASELQLSLNPWGPDYPDIQSYVEPFGRSGEGVAARVGYENPEVNAALDEAVAAPDQAARDAAYTRVQELMIEDVPFIVLYQPVFQKVASAAVQGVTVHSLYLLQLRYATKTA